MNKHQVSVFNYSIVNSNDNSHLDIYIDGIIIDAETQEIFEKWYGDETSVSFKSIRNKVIESGTKSITFWVNSYGGHVGDAMAIHDWIQELENSGYTIQTKGIGMVCSAATYIVSASKNSSITKNSWYMIHNVSGGVAGDVRVIENYARMMRKFNDTIANYYHDLTGQSIETINEWMNNETWFTGTEARDNGFVKEITGEAKFTNSIDPALFPFQNKKILTLYNACVSRPKDEEQDPEKEFNLTINNKNMDKFINGFVSAFQALNLIPKPKPEGEDSEEGQTEVTPLTEEKLTNALTTALQGFDISEMIDNRLAEMFKDGLPKNILNTLKTTITDSVGEIAKDFATKDEFKDINNEVEDIKGKIIKNSGGAKPTKEENEIHNKYDHDGIRFGR